MLEEDGEVSGLGRSLASTLEIPRKRDSPACTIPSLLVPFVGVEDRHTSNYSLHQRVCGSAFELCAFTNQNSTRQLINA